MISPYCQTGECVDVVRVRVGSGEMVAVRHSRRAAPGDPCVLFTRQEWGAFLFGVNGYQFEWEKLPLDLTTTTAAATAAVSGAGAVTTAVTQPPPGPDGS